MSAFVVSHRHIDALLTFGLRLNRRGRPMNWHAPDHSEPAAVELIERTERGQVWGTHAVELARLLGRELTTDTVDGVGAILASANVASVNYRYAEDALEPVYTHHPVVADVVGVLKALDCYEYQSCEAPEWDYSEAYAICAALRREAIAQLPGYAEAEWAL